MKPRRSIFLTDEELYDRDRRVAERLDKVAWLWREDPHYDTLDEKYDYDVPRGRRL